MTQIETNDGVAIGLEVVYTSRNGTVYKAQITLIREHERVDLRIYNKLGSTSAYNVAYDSDGQERNSWRKRSDIPASSGVQKQRCPTDNTTQFYYTDQGLSHRCRHCKGVLITPWSEVLQRYEELCGQIVPQD